MEQAKADALKSVGVDLPTVMERFVDNENLYFKCLGKYLNNTDYQGMLDAIEGNDPQTAFAKSHSLKGVTANLGFDPLYEDLKILVDVFRAGRLDYDPENLQKIRDEYEAVFNVIKTVLA